jgi:hypothetical protein
MESEERTANILLFDLVVAWDQSVRYGQGPYDQFVRENPPPVLPIRFESVAELIDYNQKRAEHEAQLDTLVRKREEFRGRFEEAARGALHLLPEGTPVVFRVADDWTRGGLQGNVYEIERVDREGTPTVEVKQIEG